MRRYLQQIKSREAIDSFYVNLSPEQFCIDNRLQDARRSVFDDQDVDLPFSLREATLDAHVPPDRRIPKVFFKNLKYASLVNSPARRVCFFVSLHSIRPNIGS